MVLVCGEPRCEITSRSWSMELECIRLASILTARPYGRDLDIRSEKANTDELPPLTHPDSCSKFDFLCSTSTPDQSDVFRVTTYGQSICRERCSSPVTDPSSFYSTSRPAQQPMRTLSACTSLGTLYPYCTATSCGLITRSPRPS